MIEETIQPLNRVFLHLGPFTVYWYGFLIIAGLLIGLWVATRESVRLGMHSDTFLEVVFVSIPVAIIFARLYFVVFDWSFYYPDNMGAIFRVWEGGLAFYGSLIGALLATFVYTRIKKISFLKVIDIAAPSLLIGSIVGRWGNFMNQEAHGSAVTREFLEGLHLPRFIIDQMYIGGQYWHPTFLYESLWNTIGLVVLLILRRRNLLRGEMTFAYLMWYSAGRFMLEGLRTDSLMLVGDIRVSQMLSVVLFVGSVVLIIIRRKVTKVKVRYEDK